jgi:hypothetical protein
VNVVELLIYGAAWEVVFRHRRTVGWRDDETAQILHAAVRFIDACRE